MQKTITTDKRRQEFLGVEGGVYVSYFDEETGKDTIISSAYIPTPKENIKDTAGNSLIETLKTKIQRSGKKIKDFFAAIDDQER